VSTELVSFTVGILYWDVFEKYATFIMQTSFLNKMENDTIAQTIRM
jgi:hypothetical protein